MITISKRNSILTGLIFITVPVEKLQWMVDFNVNDTEHTLKYCPGFISAAFLESLDGTQLFEYVQWESLEHFQAVLKTPSFTEHTTKIREVGQDDVDWYDVYYVDRRATVSDHDTSITISQTQELTIITRFTTTPDQQQALLDVLIEDHERELRNLPGFVSVSFLRGLSGKRVVEYLQFRSIEEFNVAQTHFGCKAHKTAYEQHASSDLHVYTVAATIEASPTYRESTPS